MTGFLRFLAVMLVALLLSDRAKGGVTSPLADAVEKQDAAAIQSLFDAGADVNAAQADGTTALHWAARHSDSKTADEAD